MSNDPRAFPAPTLRPLQQAFCFPDDLHAGQRLRALIADLDRDLATRPPGERRSWFLAYRGQLVAAILLALLEHDPAVPLATVTAQLRSLAPTLSADELLTFAGVARMLAEHRPASVTRLEH